MNLPLVIHREDGVKVLLYFVEGMINDCEVKRPIRETWRRWGDDNYLYVPMDSPAQ